MLSVIGKAPLIVPTDSVIGPHEPVGLAVLHDLARIDFAQLRRLLRRVHLSPRAVRLSEPVYARGRRNPDCLSIHLNGSADKPRRRFRAVLVVLSRTAIVS